MWRFADRYELHMLVQAARGVARGPVAAPRGGGPAASHEWTPEKQPAPGTDHETASPPPRSIRRKAAFIAGRKISCSRWFAFELAWVDAARPRQPRGQSRPSPRCTNAGTPEQRAKYVGGAAPPQAGRNAQTSPRGLR